MKPGREAADVSCRICHNNWRPGSGECGERSVAAKDGAAAVAGYNPKMISVARTQAADVSADSPDSVPILSLHRRGVSVSGR
jgi:hypothetical protein